MEPIPKGTFVEEYVGEIITNEEAEKRGQAYDACGLTYLFDLDFESGAESDCDFTIDAYRYGNVSHFFNHSCEPNLRVYPVFVDHWNLKLHRLAFFAIKDIPRFTELTFDYAGVSIFYDELGNPFPYMPHMDHGDKKINEVKCYCGAANCREYVHL
ncbi:hypothetical protein K7432_013926 [Basidiobolus ranarum]|uniref:Uncharacterized protein n=1 Tax=Basidiobolus ranarum TaxID=34480 RepID=A0ABR2WIE5_9FUNG